MAGAVLTGEDVLVSVLALVLCPLALLPGVQQLALLLLQNLENIEKNINAEPGQREHQHRSRGDKNNAKNINPYRSSSSSPY